ncbi:hypothetical protein Ddc_18366 [Ditylenchus destructor]|nr:hypothetical protein Ddc_18366 [Ditylenchus destructor]
MPQSPSVGFVPLPGLLHNAGQMLIFAPFLGNSKWNYGNKLKDEIILYSSRLMPDIPGMFQRHLAFAQGDSRGKEGHEWDLAVVHAIFRYIQSLAILQLYRCVGVYCSVSGGKVSAQFEQTLLVTEIGCEILTERSTKRP